jgi:hypothetical protein
MKNSAPLSYRRPRAGPTRYLAMDLGFREALEKRAELAAQGLADPDAPISLGPSSNLADYPEEELPKQ